jgi:hypothetical protein
MSLTASCKPVNKGWDILKQIVNHRCERARACLNVHLAPPDRLALFKGLIRSKDIRDV